MLSIVSATSSAPSQRGSSSSPEPQACARAACRCPAAVFQNPVRSSFWLQSLFPDWPSRLGRRSQAQETVFQALGRGQACDTGPRRLRESSTRPPPTPSLGRGQGGTRPRKRLLRGQVPGGPSPDYLASPQTMQGPQGPSSCLDFRQPSGLCRPSISSYRPVPRTQASPQKGLRLGEPFGLTCVLTLPPAGWKP